METATKKNGHMDIGLVFVIDLLMIKTMNIILKEGTILW
jgi:hypothetical protein